MTHLIHVGNSMGVRIPKAIISQLGFSENTELAFKVTDKGLLISPINKNRQGWDEVQYGPTYDRSTPGLWHTTNG